MNPLATSLLILVLAVTATGPQITHIFATPGTKSVTLTVCDKNGQCSSTTKTVTVLDPKPAISQPVVPSTVGSAESLVMFNARVTGRAPTTSTWSVTGAQKTSLLRGMPAGWVPDALGAHQVKLQAANSSGFAFAGPFPLTVVPTSFSDISPTHWAWPSIELLVANGITSGCGSLAFCPDDLVTRAQMAVFLIRAVHGAGFVPPPATGTRFTDVPAGHWAAAFIEQLVADDITSGCGTTLYCPEERLSRAQAAVLILRAVHGRQFTPPPATGSVFNDVPAGHWASAWIEQLAREGITSGCDARLFCPADFVNRAQVAVFLSRAFSLAQHPAPTLFRARLCEASSCTFPAGLPLQFTFQVINGIPAAYDYDWNGDGIYEETSPVPVPFHTYAFAGTYRPSLRVRSGSWTSPAVAHSLITIKPVSFPSVPTAPTGLSALYAGVQVPSRSDPPGTLWRTAFALQATATRHRGFLAYISNGGAVYHPVAVLPADLSGQSLMIPYLQTGSSASLYLVAFNDSGPSLPSSAIPLTLP
jgi:PKD repeat protein